MHKTLKTIAHVVLFLVAILVFYLGLGIGLAQDPLIGTALWALAALIALLNMFWIFRSRLSRK